MHDIFVLQYAYFMPLHVSSTCAHHQEVKLALHSLWYHHTETSEWSKITKIQFYKYEQIVVNFDRLCGLVVRVSGYRYRGPGFDPRRYQIF